MEAGAVLKLNGKQNQARLRQFNPTQMESKSLGCLDNKALNRSVLTVRVGWSSDVRFATIVSDSSFSTSILSVTSVNAGVIHLG